MNIDTLLSPWKIGTVEMALQINDKLIRNNKSWEEVRASLHYHKKKREVSKTCSQCSNIMVLSQDLDNKVGCYWTCRKCRYSFYVNKPYYEEVNSLLEEQENGTR